MDQPLNSRFRRAPTRPPPAATAARLRRALLATLRALGPGRLLVLSATALGLLAFFAYLILRAIEPPYTLLYGEPRASTTAPQIVGRLEALGVPFRLQGDGDAIMVPDDQALRLRLALAEEGLPRGGSVGDEIFDQSSALGTTNFLANVNLRRALEGELARTIGALADVRSARVHLVMPRHELFRRDQIEPSASITLRMHGGRPPQPPPGAGDPAPGRGGGAGAVDRSASRWSTIRERCWRGAATVPKARCRRRPRSFAPPTRRASSGPSSSCWSARSGRAGCRPRSTPSSTSTRSRMTEETFDPEGQVVRSTQTVEEENQSAERDQDDAVTVGNNLPNAGAETPAAGRSANENTTRTEETVNYEISRRVRNQTQVGGRVRRLSVAVLVDGRMVPDEAGELVYQPRDAGGARPDREPGALGGRFRGGARRRGRSQEHAVHGRRWRTTKPGSWFELTKSDLMRLAEIAALPWSR